MNASVVCTDVSRRHFVLETGLRLNPDATIPTVTETVGVFSHLSPIFTNKPNLTDYTEAWDPEPTQLSKSPFDTSAVASCFDRTVF